MSFYFLIFLFLERYFVKFFLVIIMKKGFSSLSYNLSKDECFFIDNNGGSEKNEKLFIQLN